MPMPTPRSGEDQQTFMARCMGDSTMMNDYPTQSQRVAVCMAQWRSKEADTYGSSRQRLRDQVDHFGSR